MNYMLYNKWENIALIEDRKVARKPTWYKE